MQSGTKITLTLLSWLWLSLLVIGLNSALNFIGPALLLYALIFFLLVDMVFPKLGIIFKLIIALVLVHRNYYIGSFFSPRWLGWLISDIGSDLPNIWSTGQVLPVTAMNFALAAVIAAQKFYLSLLSRGKAAMPLLFIGAALLTAAMLWTGNGSAWYVVLYVILGLVLMGTTRVQMSVDLPMRRWLGTLLIWVLVITSIAWALPDGNLDISHWWDRALNWKIHNPNAPGYSNVGYSNYDGSLGAPMLLDETPVLKMTTPFPVYLKGDVRHHYTGRSWEPVFKANSDGLDIPTHLDGEEATITIEVLAQPNSTIFVPRYPLDIEFAPGVNGNIIVHKSVGGVTNSPFPYEEYLYSSSAPLEVGSIYTVSALLPVDSPELLQQLKSNLSDVRYLQLDPGIPERVIDLAESVTDAASTDYDKAVAIARFLRRGNWDYSLDTEVPPNDQDFVDWFLFEADRGYCVHFSTAFVIMARAVGLPSRWVRGYSYGSRDEWGDFIIANKNAHAWAEVWFDGYGWVPFESTPGAVLPTIGPGPGTDPGSNDPVDPNNPDEPPLPDPGIEQPQAPGDGPGGTESGGITMGTMVLLAVALLGAGFALLMLTRNSSLVAVYTRLQTRLRLFGWQRQDWETPREHLERIEGLPEKPVLAGFVQRFEETVYGGVEDEGKSPEGRKVDKSYSLLRLTIHRFSKGK